MIQVGICAEVVCKVLAVRGLPLFHPAAHVVIWTALDSRSSLVCTPTASLLPQKTFLKPGAIGTTRVCSQGGTAGLVAREMDTSMP
jgi:hypothetical protein